MVGLLGVLVVVLAVLVGIHVFLFVDIILRNSELTLKTQSTYSHSLYQKEYRLEKITPPPVVTVLTNMSYDVTLH